MTKEKAKLNKIAQLGCIVCRLFLDQETPTELHHIRHGMGMSQRNDSNHVIPLCPIHHRYGDGTANFKGHWGYHKSPANFEAKYKTELELLEDVKLLLL